MKLNIILIIIYIVSACSKKEIKDPTIKETRQDLEIITAYKEGYEALDRGDTYFAANKFLDAELLYPQSIWATQISIHGFLFILLGEFYSEVSRI